MKPAVASLSPWPAEAELIAFVRSQAEGNYELIPLKGGANNRVFRIARGGGDTDWVLKFYFQNPGDPRDRFGAERAFYQHISTHQIGSTPEPVAWDEGKRLGLFTFVPGRKLEPVEVDAARVSEALKFLLAINACRFEQSARNLPVAAEACFDLTGHLTLVDARLARLEGIGGDDELEREAAAFVRDELVPTWRRLRAEITRSMSGDELQPLDQEVRCLSPSDFGFHNALLHPDGRLRFFDFEYAGWDDPAKTICDFFCQPELSVPASMWSDFVEGLAASTESDSGLRLRARRLWPAYQIKWCCIMMNEFVRSDKERRAFSAGADVSAGRRAAQLAKARNGLRKAVEIVQD